jgi:hypothetical protein
MTKKQLIKYLTERNIPHKVAGKQITVLGGPVYLNSLTTLPEGIKFENQGTVFLNSLTTLPEGIKFENQGYVSLNSLTTLPEGVKFENQGSVDLVSLTTLPEGIKFENQGTVYLNSLTTLPEGVKFENQGPVDLVSLTNEKQNYLGKERVLRHIDGFTMLITSTRKQGGIIISKAKYFGGGDIDKLKECFVAQCGEFSAHGDTLKAAVEDIQSKLQEQAGKSKAIQRIKSTEIVTANDFQIITGACREGMRQHLAQLNIDMKGVESLNLSDAIKAMSGSSFGYQFIRELGSE